MGKISHFSKRNKIPLFVVAVNLVILFGGAFTLRQYARSSNDMVKNVANAGSVAYATAFEEKIETGLYDRQAYLQKIANQVEAEDYSLQQTVSCIQMANTFSDTVCILNTDTLKGYKVSSVPDTNRMKAEVFVAEEALKEEFELQQIYENPDEQLHVSKEFWNEDEKHYEVALFYPISIQKERYCFVELVKITTLVEEKYDSNMLFSIENCSIINADGELLYGTLKDISIYSHNERLFDFSFQENFSEEGKKLAESKRPDFKLETQEKTNVFEILDAQDDEEFEYFREIISAKENGYMQVTENDQQYIYTYYFMERFDGWIFLNRIESGLISQSKSIVGLLLSVAALVLCFLGCNMAIIFWQNIRLRKTLSMLEKNNDELERANKAQQIFISSMSHEIRTPINAVLGMDEMIIRETSEEEIRQYAYDIKNAGKTLLGIINDILDFTKIQSGKMDIIPQDYELASMVNDLLNIVEVKLKEKNLELILDMNPDIPHLMTGDDIRIKQIILNILSNAVKYTEKGSVTFKLDYEKKDDTTVILKISVKDTGIGMKPEEMEKLTKPFERLDEKRNRTIEGTGLGMSIVTNLLTQMGSKLEVQSVYGEGSVFSFELEQPVVEWKGVGPLDRQFRDSKEEKEQEGILHARRAKVLVVDDTPVNLTVVQGLLKRTGMQVDTAQSGFECLDICREKKYDVILLDHRMPEMDGIETLHRLKQEPCINQETPVIALTANAISGAYEEYISEGFQDFLSKPVNGNKLERMILKYLPQELLDTAEELEIDEKEGIKACGSMEVVNQVRKEFLQTADKTRKEIATYLENQDIKNYGIKVHALKSTARLIGATSLSSEAMYLEQCADEGRVEEILAKTGELLKHHEEICRILKSKDLEPTYAEPLKEMDVNTLTEALEAILEFTQAFDFDQVDQVMETLEQFSMPEDFRETYEELKTAIYDVNQEAISSLIQNYLKK